MWQFDSEFAEMIQRTPSVKSFRFPIRIKRAPYKPGQFFFLTIRINGQKAPIEFTFFWTEKQQWEGQNYEVAIGPPK